MTDKELTWLAAQAAGYTVGLMCADGCCADIGPEHVGMWSPLTDDGDALRLAVKLGLSLDRTSNRCWTFAAGMAIRGVCEEFYKDDPYAATRRAIVRAAAEIGKGMKS